MKIVVTPTSFLKPENARAKKKLETFADEIIYNESGRPLQPEEIIPLLKGADGYIAGLDFITEEVINAAESLKVLSRYGAGIDRVDLAAAREKGVVVTNTPGTNSTAVAELAFALMLSLARSVPDAHNAVQNGEWPRLQGVELKGKTLGVVGLGAVGKETALRARAFGMSVIAYDPYFDAEFARANNIDRRALEELFDAADFISLHLPITEQTRHIVNEQSIRRMKDGAFLINTARGGLIDEEAAAQALRRGKLRGIALDAFEREPPEDSPLKGLKNVIFTPHTGAHTAEAVSGMGNLAVDNAIAVLTGRDCPYIVAG